MNLILQLQWPTVTIDIFINIGILHNVENMEVVVGFRVRIKKRLTQVQFWQAIGPSNPVIFPEQSPFTHICVFWEL